MDTPELTPEQTPERTFKRTSESDYLDLMFGHIDMAEYIRRVSQDCSDTMQKHDVDYEPNPWDKHSGADDLAEEMWYDLNGWRDANDRIVPVEEVFKF